MEPTVLTEPGPNGEYHRPSRRTKSVWTKGGRTYEPMACGVQIPLGGPLGPIAAHLLVPGEHNDEQTQGQPTRRDQTQPPPEVDENMWLCQLLSVRRAAALRLPYCPSGPDFAFGGPYQANEAPGQVETDPKGLLNTRISHSVRPDPQLVLR